MYISSGKVSVCHVMMMMMMMMGDGDDDYTLSRKTMNQWRL